MNNRIKELMNQTGVPTTIPFDKWCEKFAELIIKKVLDEVAERAYYSGERAWSDEIDRQWVELEFGIGKLAELKNEQSN